MVAVVVDAAVVVVGSLGKKSLPSRVVEVVAVVVVLATVVVSELKKSANASFDTLS